MENSNEAPSTSGKKRCPVLSCGQYVSSACFARHLKRIHKYDKAQCKHASNLLGVRKQYSWRRKPSGPAKKDYHLSKHCAFPDCQSVNKRMSEHLVKTHHLVKGSEDFKLFMERALVWNMGSSVSVRTEKVEKREEGSGCLTKGDIFETESEDSSFSVDEAECPRQSERLEESDNMKYKLVPLEYSDDSEEEEDHKSSCASSLSEVVADEDEDEELKLVSDVGEEHVTAALMQQFYEYLISADKDKDPKAAKQTKAQVEKIVEVVSTDGSVSALFQRRAVRDIFLKLYCERKEFEPRTVKSYLTSLDHFFHFILAEELTAFNLDKLNVMIAKVRDWQKVYQKMHNNTRYQKIEKKTETQLLPSDIQKFEFNSIIRKLVIYLQDLHDGKAFNVSQKMFTSCRNFVMAEILIENAHRSGVLANFTLDQFYKARVIDGKHMMKVDKHKTKGWHGSANLILSPRLFMWLDVFVQKIRPFAEGDNNASGYVFITWNGGGMTSGMVSDAVNAIFRSTGYRHRVSATKFRQTAATQVREKDRGLSTATAELMCHMEKTAEENYVLRQKEKQSLAAAKALAPIMRGAYVKSTEDSKSDEKAAVVLTDTSTVPVQNKEAVESPNSRKKWSEEETNVVKEIFENEIRTCKINRKIVEEKIEGNEVLRMLGWKKVLDKVRSLWRFGKDTVNDGRMSPDLPEETVNDKLNRMFPESVCDSDKAHGHSISSEAVKDIFSRSDLEIIRRCCSHIIKSGPISVKRIEEGLKSDRYGEHILASFSLVQVQNRLKYERRKLKR